MPFKMTRNFLLRIFVLFSIASASHAQQNDLSPTYEQLLEWPVRPPIELIKKVHIPFFEGIPIVDPKGQGRVDFKSWMRIQSKHSPQFIAQLEYLFPGATWAFMGRDTEAHADMVEAFYQSIGQKGRVVRIGVSKPTFWNGGEGVLIVSDEEIVESLESYGFDLRNVNSSHPFILVDTLSRGGGRQGRVIIDAVYRTYAKMGRNPAELVDRFGMIGLATSTYAVKPEDEVLSAHSTLRKVKQHYLDTLKTKEMRETYNYFDMHPIVVIPNVQDHFHECGYEHYTGAWTNRFGRYERDERGYLRARYGVRTHENVRRSILWQQKQIQERVDDPAFLEEVNFHARGLGYIFPMERPVTLFQSLDEDQFADLRKSMFEVERWLRNSSDYSVDEEIEYIRQMGVQNNSPFMSYTGRALLNAFEERSKSYDHRVVANNTLKIISAAVDFDVLTSTDLRFLLRIILEVPVSLSVYEQLKALVKHSLKASSLLLGPVEVLVGHQNQQKVIENVRNVQLMLKHDLGLDTSGCSSSFSSHLDY